MKKKVRSEKLTEKELALLLTLFDRYEEIGIEAFDEIRKKHGKDVASALLIAFMAKKFGGRRQAASMIRQTRIYQAA